MENNDTGNVDLASVDAEQPLMLTPKQPGIKVRFFSVNFI